MTPTDPSPTDLPPARSHRARWIVAAIGVVALAAVALNTYAPWRHQDQSMTSASAPGQPGGAGLVCPADAKPARLDFTVKDASGKEVSLSSFKGKVVLLDFWATWCGPCKVEIPWFKEFQERYGPQGLQVVGVSVDDTQAQLEPYLREMQMNYVVLQGLGHDDLLDAFGPMLGIPVTVVISRDGRICAKHEGLGNRNTFEAEIKSLL